MPRPNPQPACPRPGSDGEPARRSAILVSVRGDLPRLRPAPAERDDATRPPGLY